VRAPYKVWDLACVRGWKGCLTRVQAIYTKRAFPWPGILTTSRPGAMLEGRNQLERNVDQDDRITYCRADGCDNPATEEIEEHGWYCDHHADNIYDAYRLKD